MQVVHPAQLASFKGGKSWRRRFASRFKIGVRRKTNAKNKTWADTEPILLRYFSTLRRRLQLDDVAPPQGLDETLGEESGEEPEPEDINPQMEEADSSEDGELAALDSSDDDEPGDSLIALAAALLPTGYQVGSPPEAVLLEYKSTSGLELVGRLIAFNWVAVGWSVGTITSPNIDGRRKVKVGDEKLVGNFNVHYEQDDSDVLHCLRLDEHGARDAHDFGRWVVLELVV